MNALRALLERAKSQYDKVLAFVILVGLLVSLVYLAVRVGMIRKMNVDFKRDMARLAPRYEHADPIDIAPFERAAASVAKPFQIGIESWTNSMFVPEKRVTCVECRSPMPFVDKNCPFCEAVQPVDPGDRLDRDLDHDGMYDVWEDKYGLDPTDPSDADLDPDGDGFTNREEFDPDPTQSHDPTDPEDYPTIVRKLHLRGVLVKPFKVRFKSVMKGSDGSLTFVVNVATRGKSPKTHFLKMNAEVEGFKLVTYKEKSEERVRPGSTKPKKVDVSELTLEKGNKRVMLVIRVDKRWKDLTAYLDFALDKSLHKLRIGESTELRGQKYTLISIDNSLRSVVIKRSPDGREFEIRKAPETPNH